MKTSLPHSLRVLSIMLLFVLLVACGAAPRVADQSAFVAKLGTLHTATGIGTSMFFQFAVKESPAEQVVVTITGPTSWNGGEPLTLDYGSMTVGNHWRWRTYSSSSAEVVEGTYRVSARIDGDEYIEQVRLDADSTLAAASAPALLEATPQAVRTYWQPVEGAESYYVRIYRASETGFETLMDAYTRDTSTSFSDTGLVPGATYHVGVHGFNADFTAVVPEVNAEQLAASFVSTSFVP